MRRSVTTSALLLAVLLARELPAATRIDVSSTVKTSGVKRFGMNLGVNRYYDDTQIMKNLVFRNPGFEGMLYQSVVRCASGTAATFLDENVYNVWPSGFWDGAAYEVMWGASKGRTGRVASFVARAGTTLASYQLVESGTPFAPGDFVVLRKTFPGDAAAGWWTQTYGGASISTELADLPPGTEGKQCVRLSASAAGQYAQINAAFSTITGQNFVRMSGGYRLSFKAKGAAGSNRLHASVKRLSPTSPPAFLDRTVALSSTWSTYSYDFTASETGTEVGNLAVIFNPIGADVLLDDVSLVELDGDPTNTTVFRDWVVRALRTYRPGILRNQAILHLGNSLENELAGPFARLRPGFTANASGQGDITYSLHEFLELCELVQAEPWAVVPITFSAGEWAALVEYLSGPATSPWGARRAALGHPAPWTSVFPKVHLEYGNESWNFVYQGAAIGYPDAYGGCASEAFGIVKASPYYIAAKYDLILGGQATYPGRNFAENRASVNHDAVSLAPYMGYMMDSWGSNEELFGPLFAEAEATEGTASGYMRQDRDGLLASTHPVPIRIYEVNLHSTAGSISQEALDSFTPSVGAGLAVANHMLMMLRELDAKDQVLFSLAGYVYNRMDGKRALIWGVTRNDARGERNRPQYEAARMVNDAVLPSLLATSHSGDDPTWRQPLMNRVQIDAAHFLQSYAFGSGAKRSLVVFNLSRTTALDVTFGGADAPRGTVAMSRLTSAQITDNNEDAVSVTPAFQSFAAFDPSATMTLPPYSMTVLRWQTPN